MCLSLPPWADSCCLIHCRVASAFIYSAFIHTFGTVVIRVPHFLFFGLLLAFPIPFSVHRSAASISLPFGFVHLGFCFVGPCRSASVRLFFMHGPCFISTCLGPRTGSLLRPNNREMNHRRMLIREPLLLLRLAFLPYNNNKRRNLTELFAHVSPSGRYHHVVVATIGPACCSPQVLQLSESKEMFTSGAGLKGWNLKKRQVSSLATAVTQISPSTLSMDLDRFAWCGRWWMSATC